MNWRQQFFKASSLSRLVALQRALIRINSHSIIFLLALQTFVLFMVILGSLLFKDTILFYLPL